MDYNDLKHIDMPILRYDRFGRSIWHNTLAQTMLINPMDEILGFQASTPEPFSLRVARYFHTLHDVLKTQSPKQIELVLDPFPGGSRQAFLILFLPELDETGALVGVLALAQDITDKNCDHTSLQI